ncbi:PucR family transcriptional regulator [Streptomyces sp. NPDC051217]|uniref:PucR family transcriptional regulator n=1 Tax=Streptomyces sp. NPDC051217 TaxID=3365644 RepID=UPI003799D580
MDENPPGETSLRQVLHALGTTVLWVAHAPLGLDRTVTGISIQDPAEPVYAAVGEIVLGVGVERDDQASALLAAANRHGAAAVVIKHRCHATGAGVQKTGTDGTALLHLARSASWSQVVALVRSRLEAGEIGRLTGGVPAEDDLFATADAVSALVGAPLVIEDRSAHVLAYSGGQELTDDVRKRTILARRDPDEYVELHRRRNVFDQLCASDRPLVFAPMGQERLGRVAVALRAGGEIVGSMWAAPATSLTEEQLTSYGEAAKTVALHVLRARAVADVEAGLRDDLLGRILSGTAGAAEAGGRLGFPRRPYRMIAVQPGTDDPGDEAALPGDPGAEERLRDLTAALRMHLAAVRPRCVVRRVGDTVYAAVPVYEGGDDSRALLRLLEDFTGHRPGARRTRAGLGRPARTVQELRRSYEDCDKVLRVMRSGQIEGRAARIDDVQMQVLLLRLSDTLAAGEEELDGPATALISYDEKHRTTMAETLLTHFAVFGDAVAAAELLHVHPNTYRYRLRRVSSISGLDLADPDAVLAAVLQLRLHRLARSPR